MASFDYNYQNPSLVLFLMLIRAIIIYTPQGIQNLNNKEKTKGILVVVVKWRQHANLLLPLNLDSSCFNIQTTKRCPQNVNFKIFFLQEWFLHNHSYYILLILFQKRFVTFYCNWIRKNAETYVSALGSKTEEKIELGKKNLLWLEAF